jgi:hypothetical protein
LMVVENLVLRDIVIGPAEFRLGMLKGVAFEEKDPVSKRSERRRES